MEATSGAKFKAKVPGGGIAGRRANTNRKLMQKRRQRQREIEAENGRLFERILRTTPCVEDHLPRNIWHIKPKRSPTAIKQENERRKRDNLINKRRLQGG